MDKIRIRQMAFYAYHGVFPEERKIGQRFFVNVELDVDLRQAAETDDVQYSVDYGDVYQVVGSVVEGAACDLIETVANRTCAQILARFPLVDRVWVEVEKPSAPIPGIFASVSVQFSRGRD